MGDPADVGSSGKQSGKTHASILSGMRLSKGDEHRKECQTRFFRRSRGLLFFFFKHKGLKDHDAEDLASDLLMKLLKTMDTFEYDPRQRFRSYLNTAAQNAVNEFWKVQAKRQTVDGIDLEQILVREDLQERLEGQFDLELLEDAEDRVRNQVSGRDWKIYIDLTKNLATPEEIAETLGIPRHTVDMAKYRVINRIKSEVRKLEQQGPEE